MRWYNFIILSSLIIVSCSAFQGSRQMDMSPFAENTRTLFGEAIKIERPFQWKYLQPYTSIPEFQSMMKKAPPVLIALRGIIYYSNQVVAINNAKLSQKDKARMLANYLDEAMQKVLAEQRMDTLQVDLKRARNILDNIRNAESYLDAISAAEPIIHSVVAEILERIDAIQNQIPLILAGFDREIEKDFAAAKENYLRLHRLQEKMMLSLTRLYNAQLGDSLELNLLLEENSYLKNFIPSEEQANYENMMNAEIYLLGKINEIEKMITDLDDVKIEYMTKKDELVAWRNQLDEKILIAKTSLTIWARAHKNLGAGIPVPPLIDVAGMASNLAGNAAKVVIP